MFTERYIPLWFKGWNAYMTNAKTLAALDKLYGECRDEVWQLHQQEILDVDEYFDYIDTATATYLDCRKAFTLEPMESD